MKQQHMSQKTHHVSNGEKDPWLFRVGIILPSYIGNHFIKHEIRIPINQPGMLERFGVVAHGKIQQNPVWRIDNWPHEDLMAGQPT